MMNEQNNQNLSTEQQTPETNSPASDDRFGYMNQKPHYSRKELFRLGVALIVVLGIIIGGACYVVTQSVEALAQSGLFSTQDEERAQDAFTDATDEEFGFEPTQSIEALAGNKTADDVAEGSLNDEDGPTHEEPVYTEQSIEFELYEVSLSENTLVEPSSEGDYRDGYYLLKSDKVYTIQWDAAPLFFNDDGEVDAEITASSDYLIKEGSTGTITVTLRDYTKDIDYVGELKIASTDGNLGIEFCAVECEIRGYGSRPYIDSFSKLFRLCFYTSGEYVESKHDGTSGVAGYYSYEYGVDGNSTEEHSVTKPALDDERRPDPMPKPTPMPEPLDTPTPPPTP